MKGVMYYIVRSLLVLMNCTLFFCMHPAVARTESMNINISAEVNIPPCEINYGTDFNVSFGKMSLHDVDGNNNAVIKTVNVTCEYYEGIPYIWMGGVALPGAGEHVLETTGVNSSALGVALYQGSGVNSSYPLKLGIGQGNGYKITRGFSGQNKAEGQFTFTAVPCKYGTATLNAGEFSATATMSISYV